MDINLDTLKDFFDTLKDILKLTLLPVYSTNFGIINKIKIKMNNYKKTRSLLEVADTSQTVNVSDGLYQKRIAALY